MKTNNSQPQKAVTETMPYSSPSVTRNGSAVAKTLGATEGDHVEPFTITGTVNWT